MITINYDDQSIGYSMGLKTPKTTRNAYSKQPDVRVGNKQQEFTRFNEFSRLNDTKSPHLKDSLFRCLWTGGRLVEDMRRDTLRILGQIFYFKDAVRAEIKDAFDGKRNLEGSELQWFEVEKEKAIQKVEEGVNYLKVAPKPKIPTTGSFESELIDITSTFNKDSYPSLESLFMELVNAESIYTEGKKKFIRVIRLDDSMINRKEFLNYLKIPAFASIVDDTLEEITDPLTTMGKSLRSRTLAYDIRNAVQHFKAHEPNHKDYNHKQIALAIFHNYEDIQKKKPFKYDSIRDFLLRNS